MSRVHIKKTYGKGAMFPGAVVWFKEETELSNVWWFDRAGATPLELDHAVKLMDSLQRSRPQDVYELVPLD